MRLYFSSSNNILLGRYYIWFIHFQSFSLPLSLSPYPTFPPFSPSVFYFSAKPSLTKHSSLPALYNLREGDPISQLAHGIILKAAIVEGKLITNTDKIGLKKWLRAGEKSNVFFLFCWIWKRMHTNIWKIPNSINRTKNNRTFILTHKWYY